MLLGRTISHRATRQPQLRVVGEVASAGVDWLWTLNRLYLRLWCGRGVGEPAQHTVLRPALCRFSHGGVVPPLTAQLYVVGEVASAGVEKMREREGRKDRERQRETERERQTDRQACAVSWTSAHHEH